MNRQEANVLLTAIALGDNRTTDDTIVDYWRDLLADIRIEDALEALAVHRRESTRADGASSWGLRVSDSNSAGWARPAC